MADAFANVLWRLQLFPDAQIVQILLGAVGPNGIAVRVGDFINVFGGRGIEFFNAINTTNANEVLIEMELFGNNNIAQLDGAGNAPHPLEAGIVDANNAGDDQPEEIELPQSDVGDESDSDDDVSGWRD